MPPTRRTGSRRRIDRRDPASAHFRLEHSPFFLMNRAVSTYAHAMERALKGVGADIPRWRVLMLAFERGPVSVGSIAVDAVIKLSTTTKVVQRMEREGLVRLRRGRNDGRVTEVEITARGRQAVAKIRRVASGMYLRAFHEVPVREIEALNRTLGRVHSNLLAPH